MIKINNNQEIAKQAETLKIYRHESVLKLIAKANKSRKTLGLERDDSGIPNRTEIYIKAMSHAFNFDISAIFKKDRSIIKSSKNRITRAKLSVYNAFLNPACFNESYISRSISATGDEREIYERGLKLNRHATLNQFKFKTAQLLGMV